MTQSTTTTSTSRAAGANCDPASAVTRSLLGYGVIAGPLYVAVALAQALTREGFDLTRHQWSMLANGGPGWIQIANFVITGLMVTAFAIGMRRGMVGGPGARWAPRLIAVYGASLIAAGIFRADPALGFPAGTPDGPGSVSWHGLLHFAAGGVGFTALAAACIVMARRFGAAGSRGWAVFSMVTGVVFLTGFAMIASSVGSPTATLLFTGAVLLVWTWISAVALHLYRRV